MGRNEIRLRRQRMTARGIERYRNYNSVLKRHEDTRRIKKIIRAFGFFVVLLIIVMVIIFLSRWEERSKDRVNAHGEINERKILVSKVSPNQSFSQTFSREI